MPDPTLPPLTPVPCPSCGYATDTPNHVLGCTASPSRRDPMPDCPQAEYHGNPFRYCPSCAWNDGTTADEVSDLRRRIERTVEYACEIVAATEDPTVLTVMDAVVNSLRTPVSASPLSDATAQQQSSSADPTGGPR